jgi:hypothetical protein
MTDQRIKVIDSYPGSGKTSSMIDYINQLDEDIKVIYITPFLSECDRIIKNTNKNFVQPDPRRGRGRKMDHLVQLVTDGKNIVSTHALFSNIDDELINALKSNDYILILDETMNVVENFDLYRDIRMDDDKRQNVTKSDIRSLVSKSYLEINDDYSVSWISEDRLEKYEPLRHLADRNLLYFINDSLLVWTFPIEVFMPGIFEEIYILTYLFDYQIQSLYYNYFGLDYSISHIENINNKYTLVDTKNNQEELLWKERIKELITIIDNSKINRIGGVYYDSHNHPVKSSLSKSWFDNNPKLVAKLSKNIVNFFGHYTNTKTNQRMWTCFKNDVNKLTAKNLSKKSWLEITSRAVNDYGDRIALAYCINRFPNPFFEHFFHKRNITINEDEFALAEMIQWVWRSAIRNFEPITIYIPSERMRVLFEKWLNNEKIEF